MVEYKVICPDCFTAVISATPHDLIWEFYHGCGSHIWNLSDVLMANVFQEPALSLGTKSGKEIHQ